MDVTNIFHITHVDNLPGIVAHGVLCERQAQAGADGAVNSGHSHIKERRNRHVIDRGPGGVVADYAPFYFAPRCPMLYAIHRGSVRSVAHGQQEMLHLVSDAEAVRDVGLPFVFTDGHAIMNFSSVFTDLGDLDQVDWEIMRSKYWNDNDGTGERPRKRQAEFLVHRCLPWRLITEIGVYDQAMADRTAALMGSSTGRPEVSVRREWYY